MNEKIERTRKFSISVPDSIWEYMIYRRKNGGYNSMSEYMRELVRLDQRFELARKDRSVLRTREPDFFGYRGEEFADYE